MFQYLRVLLVPCLFTSAITAFLAGSAAAQHVHVFPGAELSILDQLALDADPGTVWTTDRTGDPGYFSASGDAGFLGADALHSVDGYVKYYRGSAATNTSFIFPTGDASAYRPVTISGTIPNEAIYAAAWFTGDAGIVSDPTDGTTHDRDSRGTGVLAVLPVGFWDWQTIAGNAPAMSMTVNIPDLSLFAYTPSLILVGWNGSMWVNMSGTAGDGPYAGNWATGNTASSELTGTWQPGITALAIGSSSFVLPLTLEYFRGRITDCRFDFAWKTSAETNTSHFTVEQTIDGRIWESLGRINAQGNGAGQVYSLSIQPAAAIATYRLKMTDRDGQSRYSHTVTLRNDCVSDNEMKAFPNPLAKGSAILHLVANNSYEGNVSIILRTVQGQTILTKKVLARRGKNEWQINTDKLLSGRYVITIVDDNGKALYNSTQIIRL